MLGDTARDGELCATAGRMPAAWRTAPCCDPVRPLRSRPRARAPAQGRRGAARPAAPAARLRPHAARSGSGCTSTATARVVCELCRPRHREAPERSELVHAAASAQPCRPCAPPDRPTAAPLDSARRGPRHRQRHHRPPARGGLRLPRGHREPRRSSPTTTSSTGASRARTPSARAPARASASRRRSPLPVGRPDLRRARAARTGSSSGRGGKFNRIRTIGDLDARPASRAAGPRLEFMTEIEPALPTDRFMEALGARGWMKRKVRKSLRRLQSILEEDRGRGSARRSRGRPQARHGLAVREQGDPKMIDSSRLRGRMRRRSLAPAHRCSRDRALGVWHEEGHDPSC